MNHRLLPSPIAIKVQDLILVAVSPRVLTAELTIDDVSILESRNLLTPDCSECLGLLELFERSREELSGSHVR
jgi:hypothetical protein